MSHLNHMWLSEHLNEYNSLNLYKYIWIHPKSHRFLLSGWMLLVTAAFPLHNTTWGVWLAASGPLTICTREQLWALASYGPVGVDLFCTVVCSPMQEARMTGAPPYLKDHYYSHNISFKLSRSLKNKRKNSSLIRILFQLMLFFNWW